MTTTKLELQVDEADPQDAAVRRRVMAESPEGLPAPAASRRRTLQLLSCVAAVLVIAGPGALALLVDPVVGLVALLLCLVVAAIGAFPVYIAGFMRARERARAAAELEAGSG